MNFSALKKSLKKNKAGLPIIKIAVLADSASQLFCIALKGFGQTVGINFEIWEADYNQIYQTVLEDTNELYTSHPDFVIINQSSLKLIESFYKQDIISRPTFCDQHIRIIDDLRNKLHSKLNCQIIFLNYAEINDRIFGNYANKLEASFLFQVRKLNMRLMEFAIEHTGVHICDLSSIQNDFGRRQIVSDRLFISTDNVLEIDALPYVAKSITDIILATTGKFKKCLILDLDNTIWGGIIGDDGIEGIEIGDLGIGKAYTNLQKWILELKKRGIILAVCSKNTHEIAIEPFDKHPDMILGQDDIAIFVANWENKADNIRYIQSVLNIGFDSMVFLDDNPVEREIINRELPDITVPDLPEDAAEYLTFIQSLNLFETSSFTEADEIRNKQYKEEAGRSAASMAFTDEAGFLKSLEMVGEIRAVNNFILPRAAQLTQRSNQFNLRTIRYSEEQMRKVLEDENRFTLAVSLKDKFGDYGIISLVILEKKDSDILFIDTWIMSCRVLKRNVEEFTINGVINLAKKLGCKKLYGEYIATAKNGIVKNFFNNFGFSPTDEGLWFLEIEGYLEKENFIK